MKNKDINPNYDGHNLPLRWACMHGHIDVIEYLLQDKRIKVSDPGGLNQCIINANGCGLERMEIKYILHLLKSHKTFEYSYNLNGILENYED